MTDTAPDTGAAEATAAPAPEALPIPAQDWHQPLADPTEVAARSATLTADQAKAELDRLQADPHFRQEYLDGDPHARARMRELQHMAWGSDTKPGEAQGPNPDEYRRILIRNEDDPAAGQAQTELLRNVAADMRLPTHVAPGIFDRIEYMAGESESWTDDDFKNRESQCEAELRAEWGDQYEAKLARAQSILNRVAGERREFFLDLLNATGAGNDPWTIRMFYTAALAEGLR